MDQKLNDDDEDVGHAFDSQEIDLSILDNDDNVIKYIKSLIPQSETIYCGLRTKLLDKVLILNNKKIYQYDHKTEDFEVTDLPVNSEEDYIILSLCGTIEGIPSFQINTTQVELRIFKYLWSNYITIPYYTRKFKKGI